MRFISSWHYWERRGDQLKRRASGVVFDPYNIPKSNKADVAILPQVHSSCAALPPSDRAPPDLFYYFPLYPHAINISRRTTGAHTGC